MAAQEARHEEKQRERGERNLVATLDDIDGLLGDLSLSCDELRS